MKIVHAKSIVKWFILILFVAYMNGISYFTHTHVVNKTIFTHAHPYKKSEKKQHTHTEGQYVLLDFLHNTSLTDEALPKIETADLSVGKRFLYTPFTVRIDHLSAFKHTQLRAPPALI